jgi:hypothetical protein
VQIAIGGFSGDSFKVSRIRQWITGVRSAWLTAETGISMKSSATGANPLM